MNNFNVVKNLTNRKGRIIIPGTSPVTLPPCDPPWVQIKPFLKLLRQF